MESVRCEEKRSTRQENLDDNHYKLEEMEETIKCSEAEREVPHTEIMVLQTKLQEKEKLVKTLQNEYEEMQQKLSKKDEEFRNMGKEKDELIMCQVVEIEEREKVISQINEERLKYYKKILEYEKLLREQKWELKNINIKLSNYQKNEKNAESLEDRNQKLRDEGRNKDNRIKKLGARTKFLEGSIIQLAENYEKLEEQQVEKDFQMREMTDDFNKAIKEKNDEIQEIQRTGKRRDRKLMHSNKYLYNELEKSKQMTKRLQYTQKQKDQMYLTFIIIFISWISIYPMSSYSWYHPGKLIIMVASVIVASKMLINAKNIMYDKYSAIN